MLGSDYPFPLGELKPGQLIKSKPFPADIKAQMLGQNALDWLRLATERFISWPGVATAQPLLRP